MKCLLACMAVFISFVSHVPRAQIVTTSLDAEIRDVSDVYLGFNRRSDAGTWWTDTSFISLVEEMNPDIVRYPGGTQANYWDWRTGKFIPDTDKNWGNKQVVTIPTFVHVLPERSKIVYVVNMARATPSTGVDVNASEEVLKSDATLDLKILDMLAAIDKFVSEGKKPYAIELGNEFYFGNIESGIYQIVEDDGVFYSGWDNVNNRPYASASKKDATEMTALFYLRQAKKIVTRVKTVYPDMKFALTTTKSGNGTSARERWNNTIFDHLGTNPEFASLKNDIYAVTQHHYLNDNYGIQTPISDAASSKAAIAEGIQYPVEKQADYDMVPDNYKIWYTEYGEVKGIAEETWADAVRYAAFTCSWLARGEKVNQLDFHHLTDNTVIKVGSPMRLAPVGIAVKLFMSAAAEMTEMQQIHFDANPVSANGVLSLHGYKFKNAEKETVLILNLNDEDFEPVSIDQLFSDAGMRTMTQYHSDSPWISGVASGDANIMYHGEEVTGAFHARSFSISVIETQNEPVAVNSESLNTRSVFPNPVGNYLMIETPAAILGISIFDTNGSPVFKMKGGNQNMIDLSTLASGVYFAIIETREGRVVKKLIRH